MEAFLVQKVRDFLYGVAIEKISYMWNCSKNVQTLEEEVKELTTLKETLEKRIHEAKHNGEDTKDLENWMGSANDAISDADKFLTEEDKSMKICCNVPFCVNLSTLYNYGMMATKKTSSLVKLKNKGEPLKNCVLNPLPDLTDVDLCQIKDVENINTQQLSLKKIIQGIKDHQIVGIVGLGGVGKTTLAKEAGSQLKNEFDDIKIITVSQTVDVKKIKEDVHIESRKIKDGQKILIILDDVWQELKLDEVGIPCGKKFINCKILLTSRKKDVCVKMKAEIISIDPLPKDEAWTLFERVAGMSEWNVNDKRKPIALEIVHECGGLPLFITAIGTALKEEESETWEATLNRLQDPTEEDIEFKNEGIMQLKLSYDFLKSKVAKWCFLFCSMLPEDSRIDVNTLTFYGLGLGIFNKHDISVQDARNKVRFAVDSLKSSFLLLHEVHEGKEFFKMHDLVREMAIRITSSGNDKFLVESGKGLTEWKPRKDFIKSYKKISLIRNRIRKLPDYELLFPELDTFLVQSNQLYDVPNEFFQGMKKLKVLDMSYNDISSLPRSLEQLSELTMLDLSNNPRLCEISILGKLTCLEILRLGSTGITNIPEEIRQLTNLRQLILTGAALSYVTPGVISNLTMLEELCFALPKMGNCEFLGELRELKSLKILHLLVLDYRYIPKDFHFESLLEFAIIDRDEYFDVANGLKRSLQISKFNFSFAMPISKLIELSDHLILREIDVLDNILPSLYREGFDELKCIKLLQCKNVRTLVKTCELGPMKTKGKFFSKLETIVLIYLGSLEVLWDRPHPYISFYNLAEICIYGCPSLLDLFPLIVAQELVNLKKLIIHKCDRLVAVISTHSGTQIEETRREQTCGNEIEEASGSKIESVTQDQNIVFPFLTSVELNSLPKLISFYAGHSTIKHSSLKSLEVKDCGSMKRWSCGENPIPNIKFEHEGKLYRNINDYIEAVCEMNGELSIKAT